MTTSARAIARAPRARPRGFLARAWGRLARFARDERATSDVEYILITAMVVLPMFVIPPLLIRSHSHFYDRLALWIDLPVP